MNLNAPNSPPLQTLKLPRQVEADPRRDAIEKLLAQDRRPLWDKGRILVPHLSFIPEFEKALGWALRSRQLERGLEHIEKSLSCEKKGLSALQEKQHTGPAHRISRLLIIPDGNNERFYRACEAILYKHSDRVQGLRINIPFERMGENLFGSDKLVKVLLVRERESVANVLFSLVNI